MGDLFEDWWDGSGSATLVRIALILVIAFILNRLSRRVIRLYLDRLKKTPGKIDRTVTRQETLGVVLRSTVSILIYTIAILMALSEVNIDLGPLIASAGIVGIAIGFGAQSLVRDFLSGFFMLIEDQFGVGDVIDVGAAVGTVEAFNLRTTEIRDVNGTLWHVPNGEIQRVANKSQDWARAVIDVEVAYDTDINLAMHVIKEAADTVWNDNLPNATIVEEPEIWGVENFGENAIEIRLVVKVEPGEQWSTAREIRRRLKIAFDENGIEIPFPQRVMWIKREGQEEPADTEEYGADVFLPGGAADEV
jgi:small conductance mechanosensitive channel